MECNYHLSNKYALFYNMSRYYNSIGRDPFEVLPLSFHIRNGTNDKMFYKFLQVFRENEERIQQETCASEAAQLTIHKQNGQFSETTQTTKECSNNTSNEKQTDTRAINGPGEA